MAKYLGKGAVLQVEETSTYNDIGQITSFEPDFQKASLETTAHDDATPPNSGHSRTFMAGLFDGSVSVTAVYDPADTQHTTLRTNFLAGTETNFRVVLPDAGNETWQFAAIIESFSPSPPVDEKLQVSLTLKITGGLTLDPVS